MYGVASVACFAMMDACVKWLDQFPVGEVLFSRFFKIDKAIFFSVKFLFGILTIFEFPLSSPNKKE